MPSFALFTAALVHAFVVNGWRDRFAKSVGDRTLPADGVDPVAHVTVVVAARNAGDTLGALLQDLYAQDIPKEQIGVIVVDDHSEDRTPDITESMMRTWPFLKLVRNDGSGKKAAITTGVRAAKDGIIVLTDADARCGVSRLRSILVTMERDRLELLLLPVRTESPSGFLGRLQEEEQAGLLGMAAGEALLERPSLAYGANMALTREAFEEVGGYSDDRFVSGDDVFLLQRMKQADKRIGFSLDERALVTVKAETTWSAFVQQRLRWAGKMRGVGGAFSWVGLLALILPWSLLAATLRFKGIWVIEGYGFEALLFLVFAWLLWIVPPMALVRDVRGFLGQSRSRLMTVFCYMLFAIYAPMFALASIFIRPHWKGRRT